MHRIFRVKAYEAEHGPHFNEEHARKAVSKMENEDGTRGPHWSIEETTTFGNSENNNQSMLRNALQEDVQAGDLQLNFRYLIYYNKCNNVYQLVNAYPANITAPGA